MVDDAVLIAIEYTVKGKLKHARRAALQPYHDRLLFLIIKQKPCLKTIPKKARKPQRNLISKLQVLTKALATLKMPVIKNQQQSKQTRPVTFFPVVTGLHFRK